MSFILSDRHKDPKTTALHSGIWCSGDYVNKRNCELGETYI